MAGRLVEVAPMARGVGYREAEALHAAVARLQLAVTVEAGAQLERWGVPERRAFRLSAPNFAAYLALRRHDLRGLQRDLMPFGLSSLGRSESRVLPTLQAVVATLAAIRGEPDVFHPTRRAFFRGEHLLERNTRELFGPPLPNRRTHVMVTLGTETADDEDLVRRLIAAGMTCARINCAHDSPDLWKAMARNVRAAARELGRSCRVYFDLAGPKVRTASVLLPTDDHRVHVGAPIALVAEIDQDDERFPVQITCSIPSVLEKLRPGDGVWINDGKIGCVVEHQLDGSRVALRVRQARPKGERVRTEKGLNFPGTDLGISALTAADIQNLATVAPLADIIGYSFVRTADDVRELQQRLAGVLADPDRMPLALKIETAQAVRNLPDLIVASARRNPTAVMIARGDLAVEIDYKRLAEIQEEMLWLCEAAHVPVIWATEVLDRFIKDGASSRAEFTDAAASERADCAMLNKGPHIVEAVETLSDVLHRMESHQRKNTHVLRALQSWR